MSTILVTGCAGFIGWRVASLLIEGGNSVIGIDNLNDAYDPGIKRWRLKKLLALPGFQYRQLDISEPGFARELRRGMKMAGVDRVEAVINLAARAGVRQSIADPQVYYQTNVLGTLNLLEMCRDWGISKFILASTSSLYGSTDDGESDGPGRVLERPFTEDMSTDRPLSPYAASKKAAEALCYTYSFLH